MRQIDKIIIFNIFLHFFHVFCLNFIIIEITVIKRLKIILNYEKKEKQNDEKKTLYPKSHRNFSRPENFAVRIIEKVELNFLNENFMKKLLEVLNPPDETQEQESMTVFEKMIKFSEECYIHGITAGINAVIELYEEYEE